MHTPAFIAFLVIKKALSIALFSEEILRWIPKLSLDGGVGSSIQDE